LPAIILSHCFSDFFFVFWFAVPVSVGVMMRLEVDPTQGKSRVTVRAKNPIVTQAFKAFVVEALSV
jgi:hypothetical protein